MPPSKDGPVPSLTLSAAESSARRTSFERLAVDIERVAEQHETTCAIRNAEEHTSKRLDAIEPLHR